MIEVGDRVQARKISEREDGPADIAVSEFTVTKIVDTKYSGSPFGVINSKDGWGLEVLSRTPQSLGLPTTASEITVTLRTGFDMVVIGKEDVWRNEAGERVPADQIISWDAKPDDVKAVAKR